MSQTSALASRAIYEIAAEELRKNDGQWAVYECEGNCVVLAGPGSGKTKTLTIKLARMLAKDIMPPRRLACITYSNECVRELERRLSKLGVADDANIFIGTVHSFCLQHIIIPFAELSGVQVPQPLSLATDGDRQRIMSVAFTETLDLGDFNNNWMIQADRYRRTYLDRNDESWKHDKDLSSLVEDYEQRLLEEGLVDYDWMVLTGLRLVETHEWVRRAIAARFPIIVVDEYQDLGLPLHRLVLALTTKAGIKLLAVGDPDQSIYGFTGAQPTLLNELAGMDKVTPVRLKFNYRCGRKIVSASQAILGERRGYDTPPDAHEGTIDFYEYPSGLDSQANGICGEIIPDILARHKDWHVGNIAVLYPTRNHGDVIADAASRYEIPVIRIDENAPYKKTRLTRWLEDCAKWCCGGWRDGEPRLASILKRWLSFNTIATNNDSRQELVRELTSFLWSSRNNRLLLVNWLQDFQYKLLKPMLDREHAMRSDREELRKLLNACGEGNALFGFDLAAFAGQSGAKTHLNLITLHSAKGREFDAVVMMGMDQGTLPWVRIGEAQRLEQRRLFYVGLTRAKYEVHMTYSGWVEVRGRVNRHGPSEFLLELQQTC